MIVKSERQSSIDDVESGQCTEDEVQCVKYEKKIKKKKSRKSRKRKHISSCSSDESTNDFFNPYSFNTNKFVLKSEYNDIMEVVSFSQNNDNITNINTIPETFYNLNNPVPCVTINSETIVEELNNESIIRKRSQQLKTQKQNTYFVDISGIDVVTSDLYHYLYDLGISTSLVNDLLQIISMEDEENETPENCEENYNDYEEQMINDIPIIEQTEDNEHELYGGYSPQRVNDLIEPYIQKSNQISYAPQHKKHEQLRPIVQIIDPLSIPAVGPRDPRLTKTKTLMQSKSVTINKPSEDIQNNSSEINEILPSLNIDWEMTVTNVVRTHLTLYLTHNDINKEEYTSILNRAVNKILICGERKLETDKISKFLHSYVTMTQQCRAMNNV